MGQLWLSIDGSNGHIHPYYRQLIQIINNESKHIQFILLENHAQIDENKIPEANHYLIAQAATLWNVIDIYHVDNTQEHPDSQICLTIQCFSRKQCHDWKSLHIELGLATTTGEKTAAGVIVVVCTIGGLTPVAALPLVAVATAVQNNMISVNEVNIISTFSGGT
ncbi:hypothetical protein ACJX0J_021905, partial [Zea mays]